MYSFMYSFHSLHFENELLADTFVQEIEYIFLYKLIISNNQV